MPNILLCTLGASWAVIPEAYAFLAPEKLPLYQYHPQLEKLTQLKTEYDLKPADEIWVCTTKGQQTEDSLSKLRHWISLYAQPPILRIWQAAQTNQLASQNECDKIRELIIRACIKAHEHANGGQVILSLAGGRKTMSADMQWAGSLCGCQALIHVISDDEALRKNPVMKEPEAKTFSQALDSALAGLITPLIAGQTSRSDLLDIDVDGKPAINSQDYPLPLAGDQETVQFDCDSNTLSQELSKREKQSSRLFGNYLQNIISQESHENWRSLYRLAPRQIEYLKNTNLNSDHRDWLISIPKADLHRHLGGCLDLGDQRLVAQAIWKALNKTEQQQAYQICLPLIEADNWPWQWPDSLKTQGIRSHNVACLLVHGSDEQLLTNLWHCTEPRVQLKTKHKQGFAAYERPGELSGSALLSHAASITRYAQAIVNQAVREGLAYVELRGSPQKYVKAGHYQGNGLNFIEQLATALNAAVASLSTERKPQFRFIIIVDRRDNLEAIEKTIALAISAKQLWPDFIAGLDMAGDEQQTKPETIAHLFTPAFAECLSMTIHAGEGEQADSIWQAAYHLHADRIGHGLTLSENANLAQRFRDRTICLELCPSSNREVVGFFDPDYPASQDCPAYPLLSFWREQGLPLTLCTDNPGISQTTLADEYLTAARMTAHQLSLWETLAMIKQAFVHSFLAGKDKERLIKQIDSQIYNLIIE